MSTLLHINTALDRAYVAISQNEQVLAALHSESRNEHSAFLQPAIQKIQAIAGCTLADINALSVVNGPGSYTGLRVGLSAAKGICYTRNLPLICLSTLRWMAQPFQGADTDRVCSMIDARRMEVFMAMYDQDLNLQGIEQSYILDENSFTDLQHHRILFTGNGRNKIPDHIAKHPNAIFPEMEADIIHQIQLSLEVFSLHTFSDIMYAEPFYLKSFYTTSNT